MEKNMWVKNIVLAVLVALLGGVVPGTTAYAEQVDVEEQITEITDATELLQPQNFEAQMLGEPLREKPVLPKAGNSKDVFLSQTTLKGIFSNTQLYFFIPEYWDTKYVYAQLQYDSSELIREVDSSMTFSVNGTPICSYRIEYQEGKSQTCYVEIPMEIVQEGYNSFTISAYAKLYDNGGCYDDFTSANWLNFSDTSYIRCGYDLLDAHHEISCYPYPFVSTKESTGKGLAIVVSDKATSGEIETAMNLFADLSGRTEKTNEIRFCLLSDLKKEKTSRTIIVSNYDNLPAEYQKLVLDNVNLASRATITFTDDTDGNPLLLITSSSDQCLIEAAYLLMDEERISQESGNTAGVALGSSDTAVHSKTISKMAAGNYTIKDIIGGGLNFYGAFRQEQLVYLPFSEDYFLSDAGKMTLKFRYSENLDFNRSLISVFWGDVPIASKKLSAEKAGGDELTFSMPSDVVGTTTGAIRIAFDLEIPDMACTPRMEQMPWAYVLDESTLFLPASNGIVLNFDLKPSPFRADGKFNDVMLVISDEPTSAELNLYAQLVGSYGEGVAPYGNLVVRKMSDFSENDADYNIIVAGSYQNALIRKLNEKLYFKYNETGEAFLSNEQLILSEEYAKDVAIMQLLESPYATNRGVLAITVAKESSLDNIENFIREQEKRYGMSKDCVLVDTDLNIKTYQFIMKRAEGSEPSLIGGLTQNKQSLIFTLVATSAMLMILIAVIIILLRIRMYHKTKED